VRRAPLSVAARVLFAVRALLVVMLLAGLTSCYGASNSELTQEGHGRPRITLEFPGVVQAGSMQELRIEVTNPGPGDMDSVFVAFTNVGVPGSGIGVPIVSTGRNGKNPAIVSIAPDADDVSDDGVVYRFPGLRVGESSTISFTLVMPETLGPAANSVQVYDGSEPDRAVGMRLATTVRG
jgi:hypothetical protein